MKNDVLDKDLKGFESLYPKFKKIKIPKSKFIILRGDIDICDTNGSYLKTFEVDILIEKKSYPYTVPIVKERSKLINRDKDWHVSEEGFCCLDIDHKLLKMSQRGINISEFYQDVIYPFFGNTVFKQLYNEYANGEYPHDFDGVRSFYETELNLVDPDFIVDILRKIRDNKIPGRNQVCLCGKTKYKRCKNHFESIEFLKGLPRKRISFDLKCFDEKLLGKPKKNSRSVRF